MHLGGCHFPSSAEAHSYKQGFCVLRPSWPPHVLSPHPFLPLLCSSRTTIYWVLQLSSFLSLLPKLCPLLGSFSFLPSPS